MCRYVVGRPAVAVVVVAVAAVNGNDKRPVPNGINNAVKQTPPRVPALRGQYK